MLGCQVAVDDLVTVGMVQRSQQLGGHPQLLVEGQRQVGLVDVQAQRLAGNLFRDEDVAVLALGGEEIAGTGRCWDGWAGG